MVQHLSEMSPLIYLESITERKTWRDIKVDQYLATLSPSEKQDVLEISQRYDVHPDKYVLDAQQFNSLLNAGLGLCFPDASAQAGHPEARAPAQERTQTRNQGQPSGPRRSEVPCPVTSDDLYQAQHPARTNRMANTAPSAQSNPGRASLVTSPAQAMTGRKYCRTASHQIIMRRRIKSLKKRTMNNKRALQAQIVVPTSAIARLPSEIIQDILSFAQVACRSLPSPNFANDRDGKSDEQDEDSRPRMNMHQAQCKAPFIEPAVRKR